MALLVVEPDYLPDSKVFFFPAVFIPHEVFTPQKYVHSSTRGSAEGGFGGEALEGKIAL